VRRYAMNRIPVLFLVVAAVLVLVSCGKNGGTSPHDTVRPYVDSTDPPTGATGVSLVAPVSFTFSEAIEPTTIGDTTLYVNARAQSYYIQYDNASRTATITPDTLYASESWYSAVVTEGVTDLAGNPAVRESIAFRTGPMDCEHLADSKEPNQDIADAAPVDVDHTYHSLTVCGGDKDTYEFTLDQQAMVTFATPIKHAPVDTSGYGPGWQIHFMRADGEYFSTLGTSATPGHTPSYHYTFLPGTYYCEIYSSYGMEPTDYVLYDLSVTTADPCQDDPYEDNDFLDEAAPIDEGFYTGLLGCHVDADYYSIQMNGGETVTITVNATVPPGAWAYRRMVILAPGADPSSYEGTGNPSTAQATALDPGTAYFYVMFWVDDVSYTLEVVLSG
jgi:hypothetical protein